MVFVLPLVATVGQGGLVERYKQRDRSGEAASMRNHDFRKGRRDRLISKEDAKAMLDDAVKEVQTKFAVCPTGINYEGCSIALLVPAHIPPAPVVMEYVKDTAEVFRRARRISLQDMYQETFRRLAAMEGASS
jgi:hypothetical protein